MEATAAQVPRAQAVASVLRFDRRALGAWTLGFAPVLYLALRGGGYDTVVYSDVALAAWWIVLVGALAGVLPLQRLGRLAWTCIGLLAAFAAWTLIATSWSSDAEQTILQLGRVGSYLGFLVLGLCVVRRATIRPLITGVGAAIGLVGLLATLSRLYPGAFPHNQVLTFFPNSNSRLNYPLNYADGTGELLAIGLPLLLSIASGGRTLLGRALAAAAIPVAVLALVMTASRGAVITAIVALIAFYLLAPDRLSKLASGLASAAGSVILVAALLHRSALKQGLSSQLAVSQRHQMTALVVVVCVGVALVQIGIALATRYAALPKSLRISRIRATQASLVSLAVVIVIAVAAGVPGKLAHQWNVFKSTDTTGVASGNVYSRLGTVAGSHRYQYWTVAWHALESKPLTGIGPGTYQFYWNQHSPFYESIINAHSLYLETLAETGLIGFVLIAGLLLTLLGAGVWTVMRAPPLARVSLAGATAALAGFCAAAGFDWVWQLPVFPAAALLLGAAIVAYREHRPRERTARWSGPALRVGVAVLALAAAVAIAIPLAATTEYRSSQAAANSGNLHAALSDALTAQSLEPYAATPRMQEALVYEALHDYQAASLAIGQATTRAPQNWQLWLIGSRIEAEDGNARAAVRDFRRAHALNPKSPATVE